MLSLNGNINKCIHGLSINSILYSFFHLLHFLESLPNSTHLKWKKVKMQTCKHFPELWHAYSLFICVLCFNRMVNTCLTDELKEIHAFEQKTITPEQWEKQKSQWHPLYIKVLSLIVSGISAVRTSKALKCWDAVFCPCFKILIYSIGSLCRGILTVW